MSYTALQMVNRVQRSLRLPFSATVAEYHGALILENINTVQRGMMLDGFVWDDLKQFSHFHTDATNATYAISGAAGEDIDVIRNLQIGYSDPIIKKTDDEFRAIKRGYAGTTGQPLYYRHYSRSVGTLTIELAPSPDAAYQVDTEILVKPPMLTADGDLITLDADAVFYGALMLARQDQGEDATAQMSVFQAKISMLAGSHSDSNLGDMEAV